LDYGIFRSETGDRGLQTTWFEATGEVCALIGGGQFPDAFILLGKAPSYRCLEAVLIDRPGFETTIGWVAEMLVTIPKDPEGVEALVADHEERVRAENEETERRDIASYEVVALADLPMTDEGKPSAIEAPTGHG
jgi:hypothetical protein